MKVIQLTTFYKPSVGGVERQVEEISQHLYGKGIEVEVWTTDASHGDMKRLENRDLRLNSNYQSDFLVRRFRHIIRLGHFFRFAPMLLIKLLFSNFDVIHVHNSHDAHLLGAIIIKIIRRKKLILTGHNPFIVDHTERGRKLDNSVKFFDKILNLFMGHISGYIALLETEKNFVAKYFNLPESKIHVIPNGIRDIFFDNKIETTNVLKSFNIDKSRWKLVVGAVCRMNAVKGIQNLKLAADKLKDVLFVFAGGDGGYLNELRMIYKENKNVVFTEKYLTPLEVKNFYNEIDMFVLPSIYEPFGITIVEAMTQGIYIIASNVGGANEIVKKDFGELIAPMDQQEWYEKIKFYMDKREELHKLGENGIAFAQNYRWENIIDRLIEVYR